MAAQLPSILWHSKFRIASLAAGIFFLSFTASQAGFEWVPATSGSASTQDQMQAVPPAPVEVAPSSIPSETLLQPMDTAQEPLSPLPPIGESEQILVAPATAAPAPMPVAPPQTPAPAPVQEAAPMMATPTPVPQPEPAPATQYKNMQEHVQMDSVQDALPKPVLRREPSSVAPRRKLVKPWEQESTQPAQDLAYPPQNLLAPDMMEPVQAQDVSAAPPPSAPRATRMSEEIQWSMSEQPQDTMPVETTTKIVMPDDAPASAQTPEAQNKVLNINPFPMGEAAAQDNGIAASVSEPMMPIETAAPAPALMDGLKTQDMGTMPNAEEAVGFGTDIPLALALQQIVPAGYAFSFGQNINPGARVSWSGGKPWPDVLRETIAPLNLQASIRGKAIFIHDMKSSAAITPAMPEPAMDAAIEIKAASMDSAEAPSAIEPSSGIAQNAASAPMVSAGLESTPPQPAETMAEAPMRRNIVKDPGAAPSLQPEETIDTLENNAVVASATTKRSMQDVQNLKQPEKAGQIWEAYKGESLRATLNKWSKMGDIQVEWNASHDYVLAGNVLVAGKINKAIQSLISNGVSGDKIPNITYVDGPVAKLIVEDAAPASEKAVQKSES